MLFRPGLEAIVKAIRKVSPEVYKEMNKAIKPELKFLVAASREKIPTNFVGLSNWNSNPKPHGKFPEYDPTMMKSSYKFFQFRLIMLLLVSTSIH